MLNLRGPEKAQMKPEMEEAVELLGMLEKRTNGNFEESLGYINGALYHAKTKTQGMNSMDNAVGELAGLLAIDPDAFNSVLAYLRKKAA